MSYKFKITTDQDENIKLEGTWTEHYPGTGVDEVEPLTITEHMPGLFLVNRGEADDWEETIIVSFKPDGGALCMDVMVHDIYELTRTMRYRTGWDEGCSIPPMFALALENFLNAK